MTPLSLRAEARNISAAGAFVVLHDSTVPVGATVTVEICLPVTAAAGNNGGRGRACVIGRGVILRTDSDGVALAFHPHLRFAQEGLK